MKDVDSLLETDRVACVRLLVGVCQDGGKRQFAGGRHPPTVWMLVCSFHLGLVL